MSINKNMDESFLERVRVFLYRLEDGILFALVLLMIGMAVTQILLRNLFHSAIIWGDMLVRILVLWIGDRSYRGNDSQSAGQPYPY